jgi:hypothetical protein
VNLVNLKFRLEKERKTTIFNKGYFASCEPLCEFQVHISSIINEEILYEWARRFSLRNRVVTRSYAGPGNHTPRAPGSRVGRGKLF